MRPKLVAAVLVGGTLILGAGAAVVASRPTWKATVHTASAASPLRGAPIASVTPSSVAPSATRSSTPGTTIVPAPQSTARTVNPIPPTTVKRPAAVTRTVAPVPRASAPTTAAPVASSITYTVKSGDTLSGIAEWFKLHGYGALYAANVAVVGDNPNLILPGEHITISDGVMSFSSAT